MLPGLTLPPYRIRMVSATGRRPGRASLRADDADRRVRVVRGRVAAGADRPDRLVGDDAAAPSTAGDPRERRGDLAGDLASVRAGLALVERLADADDRRHLLRQHGPHLLVHDLVGLAEQLAALGVPDDHVAAR